MKTEFSILLNHASYSFSANHFITFDNGGGEPLHGHDFKLSVQVWGTNNASEYVLDFLELEKVLQLLIAQWNHRTLLPTRNPYLRVSQVDQQIRVEYSQKEQIFIWSLPAEHCCLLEIANTTTEALAQELARALGGFLETNPRIQSWEVALTEAPGCTACCRMSKF